MRLTKENEELAKGLEREESTRKMKEELNHYL